MNYYDDLLKELEELVKTDEKKARSLIENELSAPYVPKEFEERLKELLEELPAEKDERSLSDEEIERYLFEEPEKQLVAVSHLARKNLRRELELVEKYLCSEKGYINAKVYLVAALIDQEIGEEIRMEDDTASYEFIPKYVMLPEESPGYLEGDKILQEVYLKDPSRYYLARDILYKETMLKLPVNLEEEEGIQLAEDIVRYVDKAFGMEEEEC